MKKKPRKKLTEKERVAILRGCGASAGFSETATEERKPLISRNPHVGFGRYCVADTGVPIVAIRERFRAGETIEELIDDYGLTYEQVFAAIYFRRKKR